MRAPTNSYGDRSMTAIWRTCLPFKVRSQRRLLTSCRQSFRQAKRAPSNAQRQATSPRSISTRAPKIFLTPARGKAGYLQAVDLLTQAVARDPSFFDAYCQLALAHDALYFF